MTKQVEPVNGETYTASTSDIVYMEQVGTRGIYAWGLRGTIKELGGDEMYLIVIRDNSHALLEHAQRAGAIGDLKVVYRERHHYYDGAFPGPSGNRARFVVETAEPTTT